jgi:hypothetical protein
MIIAGETYQESFHFPPNSEFFGPRLHAAAATAELTPSQNHLYTVMGEFEQATLETYEGILDPTLHAESFGCLTSRSTYNR